MWYPACFEENPQLAWAFCGHRLNLYRKTAPHQGFGQLLEIGRAKQRGYFVFTSKVDGQFQRAGFAAERMVECHGSIHPFQCSTSCTAGIWEADRETLNVDEVAFRALEPLPRCRNCPAMARPNILMLGDWSWLGQRTDAQEQQFEARLDGLRQGAAKLAVIELGAGSTIATVRRTSEPVRQSLGGTLIRINPREADVPDGQIGLPFGAAEGIQKIADRLQNRRSSAKFLLRTELWKPPPHHSLLPFCPAGSWPLGSNVS